MVREFIECRSRRTGLAIVLLVSCGATFIALNLNVIGLFVNNECFSKRHKVIELSYISSSDKIYTCLNLNAIDLCFGIVYQSHTF